MADTISPWLVNDPSKTPAPDDMSTGAPAGSAPSWWNQIFGDGSNGGVFGGNGMNALGLAGIATAAQQYKNSGSYMDNAQKAADLSNPFGDRSLYKQKLEQSYNDPNAFLNDPGHQAILKRGMQNVAGQDAMRGYLGSGNMMKDLGAYQTESDMTWLDKERERLGNLAGAQFDPAHAGEMLMKGGDQKIQSQNAALQSLLLPFLAQAQANSNAGKSINPTTGQPRTTGLNPNTPVKSLTAAEIAAIPKFASAADVAKWFQEHASINGGGTAKDLMNAYVNSPGGDMATMALIADMKKDPTYLDFFQAPTGPGVGGTNPFDPNNTNTGSNGNLGGDPQGTVTTGPITRVEDNQPTVSTNPDVNRFDQQLQIGLGGLGDTTGNIGSGAQVPYTDLGGGNE